MSRPNITLQLCTYNRADLLRRVLRGCFEQTVSEYEVVLVNDGSTDHTEEVIEEARRGAPVRFKTITHSNRGLARSRNVGIEAALGQRIIFIDDDVLPMPNFVEEHLRYARRFQRDVIRGAVIMTPTFDRLPPPFYSPLRDYSGNFFWTSNVSVPVETLRRAGAFNENFREYGWEDIELGLRLRQAGIKSHLNTRAVAFHYKPPLTAGRVGKMIAQAQAQARTAIELGRLHRHWRVPLATGDEPVQRTLAKIAAFGPAKFKSVDDFSRLPADHVLTSSERSAAKRLERRAYFEELARARALAAG